MKTIEELGQLVLATWYAYWRSHGIPGGNEQDASVEVARAIVTALVEALATALNSVPFYTSGKKFLKDYPPIPVDHLLPEKEPSDQAKLWLDALQLQADARRAWRARAQRASALLPLYERKMEQ